MESFHSQNPSDSQCSQSYIFTPEDLADIPHPDDFCEKGQESPVEDKIELPLPPGTSSDDFAMTLEYNQQSKNTSDIFSHNESLGNSSKEDPVLMSESFNILPLNEDCQQKPDLGADELVQKPMDIVDDSKYSPSKADSDEENQDFVTTKPKVLGKEQAKKRLMAFSLSKQPSASIKKQNKAVTPIKNKEKPPNPNKGSNVQEQFRATMSAIEEEKKKMFQNMPNYLLQEMNDLTKLHSLSSSSVQNLEKSKSDADPKNKGSSSKDGGSNKSHENRGKRSSRRSRSRSSSRYKSKRRRRSRSKRRSRSNSKSRNRRRSSSRSKRNRSDSKRSREDKNYRSGDKSSRESQSLPKKKSHEDWTSYKSAGLSVETDSKNPIDEAKPRRDEHNRRSPSGRTDFKPIFNYLNKGCNPMTVLQARPADPGNSTPISFPEKTLKFTRTKPIISWAENPSLATEFYMSKQMLLENCDDATAAILISIIENKSIGSLDKQTELQEGKNRPWYPRENYLLMNVSNDSETHVSTETHSYKKSSSDAMFEESSELVESKQDLASIKEDAKRRRASLERKVSLVNDSYLSDEEEQVKEMIVGEVKVQLDLDRNRVKVRSKWDSDYEGENSEKESVLRKGESKGLRASKAEESKSGGKEKTTEGFGLKSGHEKQYSSTEKKKSSGIILPSLSVPPVEAPSLKPSDVGTGNLVSEYEEFLKMVSVDVVENQKEKVPSEASVKSEKPKMKKGEKSSEDSRKSPKLGSTDWDQESDRDEKSKKMQFGGAGSHEEFLILKGDKSEVKKEGKKKKKVQKKIEKVKEAKVKVSKKTEKGKKKRYEDSCSGDSSSESCDSDSSDSESDDSESSRKRKKKKYSKVKKNYREESSSESESDSDESKTKKKKAKQKKGGKKKKGSSDSDEVQSTLLKQLDFKKQLIMKKIEEIDSISDKSTKKKQKESRGKKKEIESSDETDSEKYRKSGKKKKAEVKTEKDKKKSKAGNKKGKLLGKSKKVKKSKSSSESESETSDEDNGKKKKSKKLERRRRDTSEDSDSEEKRKKPARSKSDGKSYRKSKKARKDSSSSESDSEDSSKGKKRERKKKSDGKSDEEKLAETTESGLKENLLLDEEDVKCEKPLAWEGKKVWKKVEGRRKKKKDDDDWEASSSVEDSDKECKTRESSWDEEVMPREAKTQVPEENISKTETKTKTPKKQLDENLQNPSDLINQLSSGTLKSSLSVFSFNENSFCSFGQELSRDFFLTELSYSNSGNVTGNENLKVPTIEPRPFQSVSKDAEMMKTSHSELYSPGHSDSEGSDGEANKPEKPLGSFAGDNRPKEEVYDPLNCDSEGSVENNKVEVKSIPLPRVSDILLPGETRNFESIGAVLSSNPEGGVLKSLTRNESDKFEIMLPSMTPPLKSNFAANDFTPVEPSQSPFSDDKSTPTKKQLMSVKGQPKLISKAASVFQDESDEENIEPSSKGKAGEGSQRQSADGSKEKTSGESRNEEVSHDFLEGKSSREVNKRSRDKSRERSLERSGRGKRSRSREGRSSSKSRGKKAPSPTSQKKSRTPELVREKREIRSDSFEIEPLKSCIGSDELTDLVQPIPVLTGLETSNDGLWSRSLIPVCEFPHASDNLIDNAESFDIYPSEESAYRSRSYEKEYGDHEKVASEKPKEERSKKEKRKSRSRSYSPKKKLRSKSPEKRKSPRNRSPRRKSLSPKRKDKSPFSPRRRSPKRKSPPRRYKNSRSPDKRRKSRSRSPRKRRSSPSRRSRSLSPRKYRSPKYVEDSPRRRDSSATAFSPRERFSPRKDPVYPNPYPDSLQNRIPVIGTSVDDPERERSPSALPSPMFENAIGFPRHMADSSAHEPDMYNSFYEGEYADEFGMNTYPEEVSVNNLITVKNHDLEKTNSSERLSLDQRIELELGAPMSAGSQAQSEQYQVCPQFQDATYFQNSCNCDNGNGDTFYQSQSVQMNDFNGQYFNGHQQQSSYRPFQQYPNSQPVQNSVLQVGNIVEVVPTPQHPPPSHPSLPPKPAPQIMQVGNVLQVVPSQKPVPPPSAQTYPEDSPAVKIQKATAVVAPSSVVPTPNPEAVLSPLIKAIQLEREKRRKEKEKRKAEREARRKARQLRREAKLMLVNEKLKKSVQNEGLMLGQEVEDDELLDGLDVPSPPIPVEIITVSSPNALPPAGKGILITAGFMPKPPSEKKEVKFADGVCPGEGTSTSGGEEIASPPPKPKLPKEKRFKKRKTKVKKKVKVQIIRQIIQEEDDDDDDLSPPPPPPGDPPPVFFARFPFAGEAQFPVYQTQTTTTTLTTVQYPNQSFE